MSQQRRRTSRGAQRPGRHRAGQRASSNRMIYTGAVTAALLVGIGTAKSAFTAQTSTPTNSFKAGTVTFDTSTLPAVTFNAANLQPGSMGTSCVDLSYTGTLPADVRLYAAGLSGTGLGSYLTLLIAEGNQGTNCAAFTGNEIYSGTVADFAANKTGFGTGVGAWPASTTDPSRPYQFQWQLQSDSNAKGKTADVTFTWQARN